MYYKLYLKYFFVFLIGVCIAPTGFSQILDDSTKQVYGPKTTLYYLEQDVLDDQGKVRVVDTSINRLHQFSEVQRNQNFYQDMGGYGTALRPLFFQLPGGIGTRLGITPYQTYAYTPENIRYFDTRSPYTRAYYAQGTNRDQMIDFLFSRSINENWNVGINYIRLNSNKQYGSESTQDILAESVKLIAHTSFQSKNKKYRLLYHYAHLNQMVEETGGVVPTTSSDSLFQLRLVDILLGTTAESWQTQNNHHLYHHYKLDDGFTLFHVADIQRQRDNYTDTGVQSNLSFYPYNPDTQIETLTDANGNPIEVRTFNFNPDTTNEGTIYRLYENRIGIKGKLARFNYLAYFKNRFYNYTTSYEGDSLARTYRFPAIGDNEAGIASESLETVEGRLSGNESFIGGKLFYQFSDSIRLETTAEYLLETGDNPEYLLQGELSSPWFNASVTSRLYSPSLIQQQAYSNHFLWRDNSFSNTAVNQLKARLHLNAKQLYFSPFASYSLISNYVYYNTLALPEQTSGNIQFIRLGGDFQYQLGSIRTEIQLVYSKDLAGLDLLRLPETMVNARIYCEDCLFGKLMHSQVGIELHYKSSYYADWYMPVTKQFYLQDIQGDANFLVESYVIADIFANFKVKNFRFFVKLSHANQPQNGGYITTPVYPGLQRTFHLGIKWMFFN